MIRTILLSFFLTACTPQIYLGMSMNNNKDDFPDDSPLGIIRIVDKGYKDTELFCEHISSIPDGTDKGLNMCGALWRIK